MYSKNQIARLNDFGVRIDRPRLSVGIAPRTIRQASSDRVDDIAYYVKTSTREKIGSLIRFRLRFDSCKLPKL